MLAHLIQQKGKGGLIFALPLLIAFSLFLIFDGIKLDDKYIGAISLLTSSVILFWIDYKREIVNTGLIHQIEKLQKGKNTFMWIDMRYWAIVLFVWGMVLLIQLEK